MLTMITRIGTHTITMQQYILSVTQTKSLSSAIVHAIEPLSRIYFSDLQDDAENNVSARNNLPDRAS